MKSIDLVRFAGDGTVEDLWGSGYFMPFKDKQQDYINTIATNKDGVWSI